MSSEVRVLPFISSTFTDSPVTVLPDTFTNSQRTLRNHSISHFLPTLETLLPNSVFQLGVATCRSLKKMVFAKNELRFATSIQSANAQSWLLQITTVPKTIWKLCKIPKTEMYANLPLQSSSKSRNQLEASRLATVAISAFTPDKVWSGSRDIIWKCMCLIREKTSRW